ncbi:hypothetical protein ACFXAW_21890 [Streptomyces sp. NPDC059445]|uniref:hypothetical protein n=1 Tax=Streptomyces sp. NPDC059445 TaxID=3346832 RepID=UPI0036AAA194
MARKKQPAEEPSRTRGACVLVALGGVVVAAGFAIDEAAGVLLVVIASTVSLWRAVRRMSDSSATPPPRGVAPSGDVYAGERCEIARVVPIAEGVGFILHPVREEVNDQ